MTTKRSMLAAALCISCGASLAGCEDGSEAMESGTGAAGGKADDPGDEICGAVESPTQFPIVLVHAFHATTTNDWSMAPVAEALRCDGHAVYLASVPPYAGTPERAEALRDELDRVREEFCTERETGNPQVCFDETSLHLVGHSQGGLDARYVVGRLEYDAVISVTTLSAPHRGTPLGDLGLSLLRDPRAERDHSSLLVRALDALLTRLLDHVRPQGLADGFYWLSETRFANAEVAGAEEHIPTVEGVHYQSWAGVATQDGSLPELGACEGRELLPNGRAGELRGFRDAKTFGVVSRVFDARHVPNDGHIPVESAKFGDFRGCVPADHLDLIGQPRDQAAENEELSGLDLQDFYSELGDSLVDIEQTSRGG